jgi:predicted transglutaminase-like cysteine proteinase
MKRSTLLFAALTLIGSGLMAQTPAPGTQTSTPKREARAEHRANRQQKRIAQGVASGQLTPKETARLERQEGKVDRDITKAEADGKISKKEAAKIQHEQNRESRRIQRQKHDAQTRK